MAREGKSEEEGEGGLLVACGLDLLGTELDAPADWRVGGWRLEADCLPIRALDVLYSTKCISHAASTSQTVMLTSK